MSNPVIFVSLGPGEPDLITLKGLKALQNADCIFCPETRTISGQIFSRAAGILHALDIPDTTLSRFALPMSKNREQAFAAYDKVYHCHHETFSMYRRSSPLHPSPSRI